MKCLEERTVKNIDIKEFGINPMQWIGEDWMLITAGNQEDGFNTMTASWGHLGTIWGKDTAIAYIRPQRFTLGFVEKEERFTLSFFDSEKRKDLAYLGSHSGKDGDKIAETSLTPVFFDGTVGFVEAKLTLVVKKLYVDRLKEEGFLDKALAQEHYAAKDYHYVFIGEIEKAYLAE